MNSEETHGRATMPNDEPPVHLGTLRRAASTTSEDGAVLLFETDEGEFTVSADSDAAVENLSVAVEMFRENLRKDTMLSDDRVPDEDGLVLPDVDATEVRRKIEGKDGLYQEEVDLLAQSIEDKLRGDETSYERALYDVLVMLPDTEYGPTDAPDLGVDDA